MPADISAHGMTIELLLNDVTSVPSLPMFYERLNESINHPRSSIADIAKILSEDQGLTGRILKLANSPMFGYFSKIETITQSVTIIGVQQVRDLALAISVMGMFKGIPEDLVNMEFFWRHSIATGLAARIIATTQRESNSERFFVAGILHDVGRLIMFIRMPELCRSMIEESRNSGRLLHDVEREYLGYDHADVGGELLKLWKIPVRVAEPVAYHHRPVHADHYPREAAVIHFSDIISNALELGNSGEISVPVLLEAAWERLDLSPNILPSLVKQLDEQFEQIAGVFGNGGQHD